MELSQIKCVLMVAKVKSFHKASSMLHITPTTLSRQIKRIEEELGVKLFIRTTRSVCLTWAGVKFVEGGQYILNEVAEINKQMKKFVDGTTGHLVIGTIPVLNEYGITSLIQCFIEKYPNVSLEIREAEYFDLYPMLYEEEIDTAILTLYDQMKPKGVKLKSCPLIDDEFVIVTRSGHTLAEQKTIHLKETADETFIPFTSLQQETIEACAKAGFTPKFSQFSAHRLDTTLGLVAEGAGIAMIPLVEVTHIKWENIQIIRLTPKIKRTLMMVLPNDPKEKPVVKNFERFVLSCRHRLIN
ncbi:MULTISPECIES: LysR family transcriptional regulator [unclassified Sporolactobacillus]|uniref:LysR family transcriptional regulator n=1 Tax=unclassified Sporolactobacillus TaxID=2628533 RepID=UPI002367EB28|nr:LysR family transcriptional regulator [Sporolactobacillus sp. CQH2019]MDD9147550.1 LysR family transcriptional regulator [Sporolactobacillus sp. CQH2019]